MIADVEAAQAIIDRATPGTLQVVGVLTDEQIVALEGIDFPQPTHLPWLDGRESKEARVESAMRSMFAGGLLEFKDTDDPDAKKLEAVSDVTGILTARRATPYLLIGERETSQGRRWSYCYLFGGTVLEEQITDDGFHTFVVLSLTDLGDHLARFLDPVDRVDSAQFSAFQRDFASAEAFASEAGQIPEVADTLASTTVTAMDAESQRAFVAAVFATSEGVYALTPKTWEITDGEVSLCALAPEAIATVPNNLVAALGERGDAKS